MACEVIVIRGDRPGPENPMRWSHGHPVVVRPAGWRWGREELPEAGKFWIIEVPDADVQDLQPLLESMDTDEEGNPLHIRLWKMHLGDLPQEARAALETHGRVEIRYQDMREHVRNERTHEPLPQNIGTGP